MQASNPANFGPKKYCLRECICEVDGQVPCPGTTPLPKEMTGKYRAKMAASQEWEEEDKNALVYLDNILIRFCTMMQKKDYDIAYFVVNMSNLMDHNWLDWDSFNRS